MKNELTKEELIHFIDNIDDHIFSLNRLAGNTEENSFEIRKEVEMIFIYAQDFLYEKYNVKLETEYIDFEWFRVAWATFFAPAKTGFKPSARPHELTTYEISLVCYTLINKDGN